MYDKGLSVLEKYGLSSSNTYRGRGALICQTQEGLKMIRQFDGSLRRLEQQNQILEQLKNKGHKHLDMVMRNLDGDLTTVDKEGYTYLVKNWWDNRECDAKSRRDVLKSTEEMASIHRDLSMKHEGEDVRGSLEEEYLRHNQELKKIRFYIRSRKQKTDFEYLYLDSVQRYLEYGEASLAHLQDTRYEKARKAACQSGQICHGECNQHNFLLGGEEATLVNYDRYCWDYQISDLAQFMRKIMEKHNWNQSLAHDMLEAYSRVKPLSNQEYIHLGVRLCYPEKFWKISNFYYNNNKAFLSVKHMEKLKAQLHQEELWLRYLKDIFAI